MRRGLPLVLLCIVCFGVGRHSEADDVAVLRDLIVSAGGTVHANVTVKETAFGKGLFCSGSVEVTEVVLAVPEALIMYPEKMWMLYPALGSLALTREELVAAGLGMERFFGHTRRARRSLLKWLLDDWSPHWEPWLRLLPRQVVPNAATWTEADVQLAYQLFPEHELPLIRPSRAVSPPPLDLSAAQWRWALSVMLSRSFDGGIMVPFVDFANFHADDNTTANLRVIKTAKTFEKAIARGMVGFGLSRRCENEQIFLDYGVRNAFHFEAAFGSTMGATLSLPNRTSCREMKALLQRKSAAFKETLQLLKEAAARTCP